jgi:glutaredoxin
MFLSGGSSSKVSTVCRTLPPENHIFVKMEHTMPRKYVLLLSFLLSACAVNSFADDSHETAGQTIIIPDTKSGEKAPLVVIYTQSVCPHCMQAKEYFKDNGIPYINREVDTDDEHLAELMGIYDAMGIPEQKRGVPLLVIGNRIRLQGFNKDKVQSALKEVAVNPK